MNKDKMGIVIFPFESQKRVGGAMGVGFMILEREGAPSL